MKRIFQFFTLFAFLLSCTHVDSQRKLYDVYESYIGSLRNNEYDASFEMLTSRNKNDLLQSSKKEDFANYFPVISSLDKTLMKETENFQKIGDKKGCLTIIGYDQSNEPTSMNLEFFIESGQWKLDYAQILYHESSNELLKDATCPIRI